MVKYNISYDLIKAQDFLKELGFIKYPTHGYEWYYIDNNSILYLMYSIIDSDIYDEDEQRYIKVPCISLSEKYSSKNNSYTDGIYHLSRITQNWEDIRDYVLNYVTKYGIIGLNRSINIYSLGV